VRAAPSPEPRVCEPRQEQRRLQIPKGELTKPLEDDLEILVEYERKSNIMKLF
jgi:hypothetical protein